MRSRSVADRKLDEYEGYAVNLTEYALKYIGCSNVMTWSDDLAAGNNNNGGGGSDSVLKMDKFVVLRLCPRDSCSNYNDFGCMEQFGDYLIPMETYLQVMAETYFTQYQEYCETCYECMAAKNDDNYNGDDGNNKDNQNKGLFPPWIMLNSEKSSRPHSYISPAYEYHWPLRLSLICTGIYHILLYAQYSI